MIHPSLSWAQTKELPAGGGWLEEQKVRPYSSSFTWRVVTSQCLQEPRRQGKPAGRVCQGVQGRCTTSEVHGTVGSLLRWSLMLPSVVCTGVSSPLALGAVKIST